MRFVGAEFSGAGPASGVTIRSSANTKLWPQRKDPKTSAIRFEKMGCNNESCSCSVQGADCCDVLLITPGRICPFLAAPVRS